MSKKSSTFEENLERLASIVEQVEDSRTPLEKSISLYKEGLGLAMECGGALRHCESEILTLRKTAADVFNLEIFSSEDSKPPAADSQYRPQGPGEN